MESKRPRKPSPTPRLPGEPDGLWRIEPRGEPFEHRPAHERAQLVWNRTFVDTRSARTLRSDLLAFLSMQAKLNINTWRVALVVSPPSNGGTSLLHTLVAEAEERIDGPIVSMRMPSGGGVMAYVDNALQAMGSFESGAGSGPGWRRAALLEERLKSARVKGIALDGAERLLLVTAKRREREIERLRAVFETFRMPLIMVAPPRLAKALCDAHNVKDGSALTNLINTFQPFHWPRARVDADYLEFLDKFERTLPLRRASDLAQREMALLLYAICDGLIGPLASVLRRAAAQAIEDGTERITIDQLDGMGFEPAHTFTGFRF